MLLGGASLCYGGVIESVNKLEGCNKMFDQRMSEFERMAKELGVKVPDECKLPTKAGSAIRTGRFGVLILRVWNECNGTGDQFAWTDGIRDIPVKDIGTDWEVL